MDSFSKVDHKGVKVNFSPKSVDSDGNVNLTPQEFYGLIRAGGSVPGQKNITLSPEEFAGLMESGGWSR